MQVLYSCLVQHFMACVGASPPNMAAADELTGRLALLTPVVPFYAASVFQAWISRMNERLVADLAAAREAQPDEAGRAGELQLSCKPCFEQLRIRPGSAAKTSD